MPRRSLKHPRQAFSLTELLVVIAIMVLVLAAAVPAFRFMTGSRSVDAAQNNLSAILGRARATALSLQKQVGVFFHLDTSGRVVAALVQEANYPTGGTADVYLDLISDQDVQPLPPGVGVQVVDDCYVNNSGVRLDDGYIGYNIVTISGKNTIPFGGVILFDGMGRLEFKTYGFLLRSNSNPTAMGQLLLETPGVDFYTLPVSGSVSTRSQIGLVAFDKDAFTNNAGTDGDPQIETPGTYPTAEQDEEIWIDNNALPLIVNRYNGTLIRGE
jgi:prepilin-type N-terminal cleavage/methylation domain-containing protein